MGQARSLHVGIVSLLLVMNMPVFGSGDPDTDITREIPLPIPGDISSALHSLASGPFIENGGQWDPEILFVTSTDVGKVALCRGGIIQRVMIQERARPSPQLDRPRSTVADSCDIGIMFEGGSPSFVVGEGRVDTIYNYYLGNDSSRWATDLNGYRSVLYAEVWPGIDIVYHQRGGRLKYDIILSPGADPDEVKLKIDGAISVHISEGSLVISTPIGVDLIDSEPIANYDSGESVGVALSLDENVYSFNLAPYDHSRSVVIDPEYNVNALNFSTYIGGQEWDYPRGVDTDRSGDIYIVGSTNSRDFPLKYAYQNSIIGTDAFILKLDKDGTGIKYSTFIGGSGVDHGTDIKIDSSGCAFITGKTGSIDFPVTAGAYDNTLDYYDLFILKLNNIGNGLLYSTYLGGSGFEGYGARPILYLDEGDRIYIASNTNSDNFPVTSDAFQASLSSPLQNDMIIVNMDLSSMTLLYSTYLGGTDMDYPSSIVVANGYAYIGGTTYSNDFNVTSGAYLTSNSGGSTGFILKFDMKQRSLVYCTYFGGSGDDKLNDIAVDVQGNVYACGNTGSIDLPVPFTALGTTLNGTSDGFVMCLDPKGSALLFSSFIGGSGEEVLNALFVDPDSNIHLIGYEKDPDEDGFNFPTMAGVVQEQARGGEEEVVYVKLDSNASHYLYSTFLGGNGDDKGLDIFVDPSSGEPVIVGHTSSSNFPVKPGSFDTSYTFYEIFVTKFVLTFPPSKPRNLESRSGDSNVELRWEPPSDDGGSPIIKYSVWRGSQSGNLSMRLDNVTCLTYNDTSVENGHVYYYGVRALNRAWEGPFSDEVSSYPVSIPTSPRNLRIASWGDEVLELSWMYPNYTGGEGIPIRGYNLYRIAAGEPEPLKISIDGSLLHYSDENVMNGVNYSYRATAFNDHGESPPSDPVHAVPMTIPTGVTDPFVLCGSRFAHLFWGPPDDDGGSPILDYMILREEGPDKKLITLDGNHTDYNDTSLVNGKSYKYTIKARNVVGFGPLSDFATCEPMGRPSSPRNVILEVHPGSITLSWFPPLDNGGSDIEEYLIYRSMDGSEWTMIMSVPFTDLSYADKCLINGKTYHYSITAKNHFQESEPSIALKGTPLDVPGMPPMLTLTAGDGYVLLNWETSTIDGGTPILGFWILRGKNESSMVSMTAVGANVLMFNDTTVENGKEYLYQVKAFNAFGMGRGTGFISAIPAGLPSPPVIVIVTSGDRFVEIEWSEPLVNGGFPINTVRIYKWTETSSASVILRTDDAEGSFKDISVENGITYMYALSCENDIGEGSRSCVINATPLGQPSAPTRVSINPLSPTSVEISWGSPQDTGGSPILRYHIYRSEDSESWRKIAFISGDELNYTDPNLDSGRVYWYRVSAENAQGEGPHGEEVSIELKESGRFSGMYLLIAGAVLFLILLGSALGFAISRRKKGSFESPAQGEVEASPCDMDT